MNAPLLHLADIDIDPALVRRLPSHLAYFHVALPIAEDDDTLTVAFAQPDNRATRELIEGALGSPIVAVRSRSDDILGVLDRVWQDVDLPERAIYLWSSDPLRLQTLSSYVARVVTPAYPELPMYAAPLGSAIGHTPDTRAVLLVAHSDTPEGRRDLVLRAPAAVWLVRDLASRPRKVLAVLRGTQPDRQLLTWLPALSQNLPIEIIVLAAATPAADASGSPLISRFAVMLSPDTPLGAHLASMRQAFARARIHGRVLLREGTLAEAVYEAVRDSPVDIMVLAAESQGATSIDVVEHVWGRIGAALVIKAHA